MSCLTCGPKEIVITRNGANFYSEPVANGCSKLPTSNWLDELPPDKQAHEVVEVRFKNTRKEYFRNPHELSMERNMLVAVEAQSGHDIGIVSLVGRLAELNLKRKTGNPDILSLKTIYRKATTSDVQIWKEAKDLENATMLKARQIASGIGLNMKVSDVEYQGDKKKATFFYIADQRVDFRELIKVLAGEFSVKIEMKQIGVRQEAGRIGGIGSCGRELCCSTWRTELPTVPQSSIAKQNLSPNADKYLGQCGKLKCCLTYELDTYLEAWNDFPKELLELEAKHYTAYPHKADVLNKSILYIYKQGSVDNFISLPLEKVKEILMMNKKGIKPDKFE